MLLVLRIFRPDRVINGVKKFINEFYNNNNHYIQPPTANFEKIYQQSNEKSPIVFILSPGADPLSDVQKLGETLGFTGNKFRFLSLGQGMEVTYNIILYNIIFSSFNYPYPNSLIYSSFVKLNTTN